MLRSAFVAGLVAVVISMIAALIISFFFPTEDLSWALVIVALTCFFSAFLSWSISAFKNRKGKVR